MKRTLIALVLGSLLTLSVASVAVTKVISIGQLNAELYPDSGSARTGIDAGSRLSARLRAIDAVFYPDSFGAEGAWRMPKINPLVVDTDGDHLAYF